MSHLMSLSRQQAVVKLTVRRLISNVNNPAIKGGHAKPCQLDLKADSSEDVQTMKRSQAWKSVRIIKSILSQLQGGSRSSLISKATSQEDQHVPKEALVHMRKTLIGRSSNTSNLHSNSCKQCNVQFAENVKYLAIWNSFLHSSCVDVLPHLKPLGIWTPSVRRIHSTNYLCVSPLPPYDPPHDSLGLTYISDLNDEDKERIKNVAYEELKKVLNHNNIKFNKVKAKKKTTDSGVFGTALEVLVSKDIKQKRLFTDLKVPAVFHMMVKYIEEKGLQTEGIFRLSGSVDRCKSLVQDLESNFYKKSNYAFPSDTDCTIHDIASVLKGFLRQLPVSLVTSERIEEFPEILEMPVKDRIVVTNMFILSMTEEHRDTLQVLLRLMANTIKNKYENKMDDSNLATCMTPNVFFMPKLKTPELELKKLQEQFGHFRLLANYNKKLFTVPPNFLNQLRQQYTSGVSAKPKKRFISKLLKKKKKEGEEIAPPTEELMHLSEVEIEVHAPNMQKDCGLVKINSSTTAADVVKMYTGEKGYMVIGQGQSLQAELRKKLGVIDEDRAADYLYEVGGNIGERLLDPAAKILDLYRVNPNAEWMIKSKKGR